MIIFFLIPHCVEETSLLKSEDDRHTENQEIFKADEQKNSEIKDTLGGKKPKGINLERNV